MTLYDEAETVANLKDEWIENWLETEKATLDILWEAFNEQPFTKRMVDAYNNGDTIRLGLCADNMIEAHMRTLAAIAYDERMT